MNAVCNGVKIRLMNSTYSNMFDEGHYNEQDICTGLYSTQRLTDACSIKLHQKGKRKRKESYENWMWKDLRKHSKLC